MIEAGVTLYVYYKIPADRREFYLLAMNALSQNICALYPGLRIHQQRRPELDADNKELWMEIYHDIPEIKLPQFTANLNVLVDNHCMPKERRYETFISLYTGQVNATA